MDGGRTWLSNTLSDWEVWEILWYRRCGWTLEELATHYGMSRRSVSRLIRKAIRREEDFKETKPLPDR